MDDLGGITALLILGVLAFIIGIVGTLAGVGGGVLFTPLLLGFSNIGPDVVRVTGLAIAAYSSIMAGTVLFREKIASLKLVLLASATLMPGAIVGAQVGIQVTAMGPWGAAILRLALGVVMFVVVVLLLTKNVEWPEARCGSKLVKVFSLEYVYSEKTLGREVRYCPMRLGPGLLLLFFVGFASGFFGLGAAWALIPIYNLVMSLPLKVSVATAKTSIAIADSAALWVYTHSAKLNPEIYVVATLAVIVGAVIGAKLLLVTPARPVKYVVLSVLIFNGIQLIWRGLRELGIV